MNRLLISAFVGFCAAGTATSAFASTVTYSIAGSVSSVLDQLGLFPDAAVGQAFTATATFDLDKALVTTTAGQTNYHGGFTYGSPSFALLNLIFSSYDVHTNGDYQTDFQIVPNTLASISLQAAYVNNGALYESSLLSFGSVDVGDGISTKAVILTPFSSLIQYTYQTNSQFSHIEFSPTSLSITSDVSAVPLPASLPLFGAALLGLGALGYGARRKARALAAG